MVDVASIVVAVVSLAATIIVACFTAYFAYLSDERKRRQELRKFFGKYRDALLLAAQDLQSRICNITDYEVTDYYFHGGRQQENLLLYTAFIVGQYLCWVHIIRLQAQFLQYETDSATKELTLAMSAITTEFGTDRCRDVGLPFMLWRGEQMSIGEIMLAEDRAGPIGYGAFHAKWTEGGKIPTVLQPHDLDGNTDVAAAMWSGQFRPWFRPIVEGVIQVALAKRTNARLKDEEPRVAVPDQRLRRLQHRLVDLLQLLDPEELRSEAKWMRYCGQAQECKCRSCVGPQ